MESNISSQLEEFSIIFYNTIESETDQDDIQVSFDHGHDPPLYSLLYTSSAIIIPFFHYEYLRIFVSLQSFHCRESLNDEISFRFRKTRFKSFEKKNQTRKFRCLFTKFSTIYSH